MKAYDITKLTAEVKRATTYSTAIKYCSLSVFVGVDAGNTLIL